MKNFITKILLKLKLINIDMVVVNYLVKYKIYYMHIIDKENNEDVMIGGDGCTTDELAAFILYNLSVNHSEDVLVSISDNNVSSIDGKGVFESYIRLAKENFAKSLEKEKKVLDNLEDPVINPLEIYNNAKVIK